MLSSKFEDVLEPLFAFFATDRPFAEVSRLAVVSRNWRTASHKSLKTAPQLNLSGVAESVRDEDVRLALIRVTSENLKRVDLSGCHNISAGCMEDILQCMAEKCCGVKEVDVTACSNEAVLRAVAIRAQAVCGVHSALDLYTHLKSLEVHAEEVEEEPEDWKRYPFSFLSRLLHASTPLLLFDPQLDPGNDALVQATAHGTGSDVAMLLTLSFAGGQGNASDEDQGGWIYGVNQKDSEGDSPLLLACRSELGDLEIAEILVVAGADVSAANLRGDTPLLAAVGAGKLELAEMLLSKANADVNVINDDGASVLHLAIASDNARSFEMFETLLKAGADVHVVRRDGASALALAIVSGKARILNCRMMPTMIEYAESAEISYVRRLSLAFLEPNNIFRWLQDGQSPRELLGVVCALMASAATERPMQDRLSHVRAFINCHIDLLQDPKQLAPLTVTDVVKQLVLQESDTVFDSNTDPQWNASIERGVVWVNKPPVQHTCRLTMQARGNVESFAYSSDGYRLVRAEGNDVVVCDAVSGFEVHRLTGHRCVNAVTWSPEGKSLASASDDHTVRVWDASTGQCQSTLNGHSDRVYSVAWSPDGASLGSGSRDHTVKIWNAKTGKCDSTLNGHSSTVSSVCFSPDGKQVASGSWDSTVKLWETSTGTCQSTLTGHSDYVRDVSWSPDGAILASGSDDKTIKLWDAQSGKVNSTLSGHSDWVFSVAWSPRGKHVASGSADKTVKLWETSTGTCQSTLTGHSELVTTVSWSPDGRMLASGSFDKTIKLWNTQSGKVNSTLSRHTSSVKKVEYVDAETLISGSEDGTMRVWSVVTGAQKEELDGGSFVFFKDSSLEHKVGKYSITFKDDLLLISEGQSVVAFFRAPHVISTIGTAGERIGVGCNNGEVLQLRAHWLVQRL